MLQIRGRIHPGGAAMSALGLVAVVVLAGCGRASSPDTPDQGAAPLHAAAVCPGGSVDDGLVVCSQLHPEGDALQLPADTGTRQYGAIGRGGERFLTRKGPRTLATPARERLVADGEFPDRAAPYARTVYRAHVDGGVVRDLTPVVRVEERALMTRVFGGKVLEGKIASRIGPEDGYDLDSTLPIRIELEPEATGATVRGRIVNATTGVEMSTGACAAPLTAAGANDPLAPPFTETVSLQRYPSMHVVFDDELVLKWDADTTNMGAAFYPSVGTLLGLEPLEASWEATPHGNPTAGPAVTLAIVEGGGASCT